MILFVVYNFESIPDSIHTAVTSKERPVKQVVSTVRKIT